MLLHENQLFRGTQFSEQSLMELHFQNLTFSEGKTIFRENDSSTSLFLILEGQINLISHQKLESGHPNSIVLSEGSSN